MDFEPSLYEKKVARIVSEYFSAKITFVKRSNISKSADLLINSVTWEIKSPIGNGKRTMQNNLRSADNQSPNIIIDLARCKMESETAIHRLRYELKRANKVKQLLVIDKHGKVTRLK